AARGRVVAGPAGFLPEDPLAIGAPQGPPGAAVTGGAAAVPLLPADAGPSAAPGNTAAAPGHAGLPAEAAPSPLGTDLALWAGLASAGPGGPSAAGSAGAAPLHFDLATGLLAVRGGAAGGAIREAVRPTAFLE